jgi:cell division protein FtsW
MTFTSEQGDRQTWIALLLVVVGLVGFGTVMVYSASSGLAQFRFDSGHFFLKRWAIRMAISLAVMAIMIRIDYRIWRKMARLLLAIGFAFLLVVLILKLFGIGKVRGAYRWIPLPGGQFQPADLMRVVLVIYLADSLVRRHHLIENFKTGFLPHAVVIGSAMGMILIQPDLGTSLAIGLTCALMLYVGGVRLQHLLATGACLLPFLCLIVFVFGYRRERVMTFLFPAEDVQNTGYHLAQSLLALGSGGVWGTGLGQGQQKYFFLPEPHTDFVFSIVGEELGLLGTMLVLILFLIFGRLGFRIARTARDAFGFMLASGITCMILVYAWINMGVATGLLPATGLPLPFISYGGSSLMVTLAAAGLLVSIGRAGAKDKSALPNRSPVQSSRAFPRPRGMRTAQS